VHIHIADARRWLAQSRDKYDLVQLDVYQGGPYIPFYLVTDEFLRLTRDHMNRDALLMMNVFDESGDAKLLNALAATLRREFPTVMMKRSGGVNYMLYAFTQRRAVNEFVPPADSPVFTDDRAPVEELTRLSLLPGEKVPRSGG
ncbi:MAG TPA: fused MFS/spermidine synthase, partial [Thermoanaerobaculia bacterium]|nr:fused MFS/spermidine synthase [Thermoanaerobaculia bacterium]